MSLRGCLTKLPRNDQFITATYLVPVSAAALLLFGCVLHRPARLTPEGERVSLAADANAVKDCKFLEKIAVGAPRFMPLENATPALRNVTASRGGDTLLIVSVRRVIGLGIIGEVYRCR